MSLLLDQINFLNGGRASAMEIYTCRFWQSMRYRGGNGNNKNSFLQKKKNCISFHVSFADVSETGNHLINFCVFARIIDF